MVLITSLLVSQLISLTDLMVSLTESFGFTDRVVGFTDRAVWFHESLVSLNESLVSLTESLDSLPELLDSLTESLVSLTESLVSLTESLVSLTESLVAVDGVWQPWSEWAACSTSCGDGRHGRNRTCEGPYYGGAACAGKGDEERDCFVIECPSQYSLPISCIQCPRICTHTIHFSLTYYVIQLITLRNPIGTAQQNY